MPGPFSRSCFTNYAAPAPNPSPDRWALVDIAEFRNGYVLKVKYAGCTNFEGLKVMVYRGRYTPTARLDPHFADNDAAPVARFKPDVDGWGMATDLAKSF
jgi:hypothetical protein